MGFWAWFAIWTALVLGALAVLAYLGWQLMQKGLKVAKELEKLEPVLSKLQAATEAKSEYERPEPDLLKDPVEVYKIRNAFEKRREQKREARKHMLIQRLKHIDPAESRFTK